MVCNCDLMLFGTAAAALTVANNQWLSGPFLRLALYVVHKCDETVLSQSISSSSGFDSV